MAVHISRVEIDSCGPIRRLHETLAPLSVVYGGNERGKTTLVENIIAALFRERKESLVPSVRAGALGSARVHVTGLGRRAEVFTPLDKRKRLDELLLKRNPSLPVSLFGLLVVRAGETELAAASSARTAHSARGASGGLDKDLLQGLLSRRQTWQQIESALPGELAYTRLEAGRLTAQRRIGGYKSYEEARQRLQALAALADELSASLSETGLLALRAGQARVAQSRERQARARRHAAFCLARRIRAAEAELARLDRPLLERLSSQVQDHDRLRRELAAAGGEPLDALEADSRWLDEAQRSWTQGRAADRPSLLYLSLALCLLFLLGAIASSLWQPALLPLALGLSLAGALLGLLVARRRQPRADGERAALRRQFEQRFGRVLTTSADFAAARSDLDRRLGAAQRSQGERRRSEDQLSALGADIRAALARLQAPRAATLGEDATRSEDARWVAAAGELGERRRSLELDVRGLRERLGGLAVDESDYLEEDPGVPWSREAESALAAEARNLEQAVAEAEGEAAALRQRAAAHLGPVFAGQTRVEELAAAVETRRIEEERTARAGLAAMIAGHVVHEVLADFRRAEDEELERELNSPHLTGLLGRLTGRYDRLRLEGESLLVGNAEESYDLREMSTGAREQVLLALRLGLAAALCGREPLFLLLDDAFQHSDWQRRDGLVEQAVAAVREGWQVICFTMDDDIGGRFLQAAKALGPEQLRLIEL